MKSTETNNYKKSQRELSAGVLKQAEQDLQRFHAAPSAIEQELYLDAYRWVISDDSTWPFSFLNVCQSLNLVLEDVRQDLIGQLWQGTFRRWINHYRRTIQKLAMFLASVSPSRRTMAAAEPTILVHTLH
jgi:hypothetical protein